MNKLQKLFLGLRMLLKKPSLINLITESDDRWNDYLSKKHPTKTKLKIIDIDELLPNFNKKLNTFSFLGGGSLPTDLLLLKGLCASMPNCDYFEIGTWRGESVANVAEVCHECYTLNLSEKEIIQLGLPKKYAELHGFFSKKIKNITHLLGNSRTYNLKALNKKFDVIFIDGNHKYDFVKSDTKLVFEHLVKENSMVVWHDYAYNPEMVRSEILAGILDGIPETQKNHLYHVSNTMCAIYTHKKIKTTIPDFPVKPNKIFEISLKSKKISK